MNDTKFRACHDRSRARRATHLRSVRRFWKIRLAAGRYEA